MEILHIVIYASSIICNVVLCISSEDAFSNISKSQTLVWGPGLDTDFRVPVRYFYIQAVSYDGQNVTQSIGEKAFTMKIEPSKGGHARIWTQVLDRHDGTYIARFRLYSSIEDLIINVKLGDEHVANSPYLLNGMAYHEFCNCPNPSVDEWAEAVGCPSNFSQIGLDLVPFKDIDMPKMVQRATERFKSRGSYSFCHYKIKDNEIYRKCYGEHVGFNMFSDAIITSLTRKMVMSDLEFIMNLGDWPLEQKSKADNENPIPIISWCGSQDSHDIVLPTYDLTEATLEMMGRVSLDIFSTQANTGPKWENKTNVAFWRGRDSRRERLQLVEMSRENPSLLNAALTNMYFFPKDEDKYGPLQKHVSFFDFFKWKYQLNIDGTVAAYRLPYLLAGDSVVFKQDSDYYEHFYHELLPYIHYIPIKSDLSDVLEKIKWARDNDEKVQHIAKNGQDYARSKLNPVDVFCYHARLFQEYSKLLSKLSDSVKGFDHVSQRADEPCDCRIHRETPKPVKREREEL